MITFARETPRPRLVGNWPACARAARQLLEQREDRYPALVEAGKLDAGEADRGLRVMGAVAALWDRVEARASLPEPHDYPQAFGSSWAEMAAELARAARRTAEIAAASGERAHREQAELAAALLWHMEPVADGAAFPHIHVAQDFLLWESARQQDAAA